MKKQIWVKYHTEEAKPIWQAHKDEWFDLRCAENVTMMAGEYKLISLGVAMQLPEGYEAIVAPRSSTFSKYGIMCANGIGIIDNAYCGENDIWKFPAYATRDTEIKAGERIAQFRLLHVQQEVEFVEVQHMLNEERGGVGSTGRE